MRLKIQRLKELEIFNSLRLSIVVTTKIFAELINRMKLFMEILIKAIAEVAVEVKAFLVVYYLDFSVN